MKTKSILIIALTLILGFLLGILSTGMIQRAQFKKIRNFQTERGFGNHIIHIIEPTDNQLESIQPILDKYGKEIRSTGKAFRNEMKILMDSMHQELRPFLTEEQFKRMQKRKFGKGKFLRPFPHKRRPPFFEEEGEKESND